MSMEPTPPRSSAPLPMREGEESSLRGNHPLLKMEGITKSFDGIRALGGVNFDVMPGEVHALVGENGAGKSTLMKILAGALQADAGRVSIDGEHVVIKSPPQAIGLGIRIIYQELNLVPHLSVAENIFLGHLPTSMPGWVSGREMIAGAEKILADLGLNLDVRASVNRLSIAQQQMVEIAKAISRKARIIAMDEPSASLTQHEQENLWRLVRTLRSSGVGVIYISHRMNEVFDLSDRITVLRDGQTVATHATADVSEDQIVSEMVGRVLDQAAAQRISSAGGALVLEVRGLTSRGRLTDVSFDVRAGEVVALAGLVGAGRTEIARCLFGADRVDAGTFRLDGRPFAPKSPREAIEAGIGFLTEDRKDQGLILRMTIRENTTLASMGMFSKFGWIQGRRERARATEESTRLRVRTSTVERAVGELSGGNQQKVVLAKWLLREPRLLILDEPTRGIDVAAKAEIYELMNEMKQRGVAILMISSDLPEVLATADRVIVIRGGRVAGELSAEAATQESVGRLAIGAGVG